MAEFTKLTPAKICRIHTRFRKLRYCSPGLFDCRKLAPSLKYGGRATNQEVVQPHKVQTEWGLCRCASCAFCVNGVGPKHYITVHPTETVPKPNSMREATFTFRIAHLLLASIFVIYFCATVDTMAPGIDSLSVKKKKIYLISMSFWPAYAAWLCIFWLTDT